jgi:NAD(P)-dependent dehydrogenase (short-subunit alcohol dehydrogenase family)
MAMDFARDGVRVNAVCPGTVDTPMLKWAASLDPNPDSVYAACNAMHPLGRIAQPNEIAEVVAFLGTREFFFCNRFRLDRGRRSVNPDRRCAADFLRKEMNYE